MPLRFRSCMLLINPTRHPRMVERLTRKLENSHGIEVVVTESKEHFRRCAREFFLSSHENLLVWGGDGTAHDAINVIYPFVEEFGGCGGPRKAVGFLRGGTGNGIQDSYEVPYRLSSQLASYARSMRNGYRIDVDLLRVDDGKRTRYGQLVGVGFDADILVLRERISARGGRNAARSGVTRYVSAGIRHFLSYDFKRDRAAYDLELADGKYAFHGPRVNAQFPIRRLTMTRSPLMIEVGTRPYYGKLFKVCPDVVCNDGDMNVYLFDFSSKWEIVRNLVYIWTGRHSMINRTLSRARKPVIERYEVRHTRVGRDSPFAYHIDGELLHADQPLKDSRYGIDIEILPQALTFLVPAQFYHIFHPFTENPDVPDVKHEIEGADAVGGV